MFEQSMIPKGKRKTSAMVLAVLGQLVAIAFIVLVPLMFVQALPTADLEAMLVAPPPPPPPPPPPAPAAVHAAPRHIVPVRQFDANALVAPKTVPKQVAVIQDLPADTAAQATANGVVGGVPGGVPGGVVGGVEGGVLGSLLNSAPLAPPPPPPPPKAAAPAVPTPKMIHVGGNVEAAKLLSGPKPAYPAIAREARVSGTVDLKAIIGKDGKVQNLTVTDGNPLLVGAAMDAVRKWVYKPTYLNGLPVSVATEIEVTFNLG